MRKETLKKADFERFAKGFDAKWSEMAQQMDKIEASIVPLDKWGKMVYTEQQQGCEANRQALTVPIPPNPSKEDIMKHLALAFAALLSCNIAAAQATTAPADTKLPPVTVEAPKKADDAGKWSKCDLACRMNVIVSTLEKSDCRQDMATGFNSKRAQAVIMKVPTKNALEARVEEICKEDLDRADKTAEDLRLDEPAATEAGDEPASVKMAGREDRDLDFDRGPRFDRRPTFGPGRGRPHGGRHQGAGSCKHWPGFKMMPNGRCEQTFDRDERVVKYDRPSVGCKAGDVMPIVEKLPGGGTRTVNMRCRYDSEMRR